jgi:transcriptional regulator with XRE-family HTH domain
MAEPAERTLTRAAGRSDEERARTLDVDRFVSLRIRQRRMMLGLTQQQMAELIGVDYRQAHKYETGVTRITAGRLYRIAQALGVDVGYFYGEVDLRARSHRDEKPAGAVKFLAKLEQIWQLDQKDLAKLVGVEGVEDVRDLLSGAWSLETRDAKDRFRHLMRIREALHSLFQNLDAEREWLREPRLELQGQSPLAMMLEGSMENLLTVSQFVQWMVGR